MNKRRGSIAVAAGALGVAGIAMMASQSTAQACGGNKTSVMAPVACTVTKSGVTSIITVTADGHITVDYSFPPAGAGMVQVAAHKGTSAGDKGNRVTAAVAAGDTAAKLEVEASGCGGQIDVKFARGLQPTIEHIDSQYRVQAPVVYIPNCLTGQEVSTSGNETTSTTQAETPPSTGLRPPVTGTVPETVPSGTLPATR